MTTSTKPVFRALSRKPFAGELPVIEAVRNAHTKIAAMRDLMENEALFRSRSDGVAAGKMITQAVDIVSGGIAQAVAMQRSIVRAVRTQDSAAVLTGEKIREHAEGVQATQVQVAGRVQSGVEKARADIAASLSRLNA